MLHRDPEQWQLLSFGQHRIFMECLLHAQLCAEFGRGVDFMMRSWFPRPSQTQSMLHILQARPRRACGLFRFAAQELCLCSSLIPANRQCERAASTSVCVQNAHKLLLFIRGVDGGPWEALTLQGLGFLVIFSAGSAFRNVMLLSAAVLLPKSLFLPFPTSLPSFPLFFLKAVEMK